MRITALSCRFLGWLRNVTLLLAAALPYAPAVFAQQGGKQSQSPASGSSSNSASGTPAGFIAYDRSEWPSLTAAPDDSRVALVCYTLVYTYQNTAPYALRPVSEISHTDGSGLKRKNGQSISCRDAVETTRGKSKLINPLQMDQLLVVAIDARNVDLGNLRAIYLGLTLANGSPINPSPTRGSTGAGVTASNLAGDQIYFFSWNNRLPGDMIPTLNLSLGYTLPAPGDLWRPNTFYPAGSVIAAGDGHYYSAYDNGVSKSTKPTFVHFDQTVVTDNAVKWLPLGAVAPASPGQINPWKSGNAYNGGDVIFSPSTSNYFMAQNSGSSGSTYPAFAVSNPAFTDETAAAAAPAPVITGDVVFVTNGQPTPTCTATSAGPKPWRQGMYMAMDQICDPATRLIYVAQTAGNTGSTPPVFPQPSPDQGRMAMRWKDMGNALPSSVASASFTDPALLSVMSLPLPQVHSLSYFNVASGVVFSSLRTKTFGFQANSTGGSTGIPVQTGSSPLVDPVLFVTAYPLPFDAERPWRARDLIPGISFGLSLASPSSNFYFGGSSEILRFVQLVYGANFGKVSRLASGVFAGGTANSPATTPPTVQSFGTGVYGGLTFNISGFIQTLFSGGSSSGKSSTGASSSSPGSN